MRSFGYNCICTISKLVPPIDYHEPRCVKHNEKENPIMSHGKDIFQGLLEAAINHYSRESITAMLNFVASLSQDDLREWTAGMSPEESARVHRIWMASQMNDQALRSTIPE